jgi:hypothetical protein
MDAEQIKEKLDRLAEFYSQKDSIEASKRAMLDEVKIPAEVERTVKDGMQRMQAVDAEYPARAKNIADGAAEQLAEVQIPDEIRAMLDEIDRHRDLIRAWQSSEEARIREEIQARKAEIQAEVEAETRAVYDEVARRKAEIAEEFAGKERAAAENIAKLEAEIKEDVKATGQSVKGSFFHAVYVKGRITWNTDKMEAWIIDHPFLMEARKEGAPSVTLRKV